MAQVPQSPADCRTISYLDCSFGICRNIISALMLRSGSKVNLNMKSAFLHMLSDAATSLVVAILGVVWISSPGFGSIRHSPG